MKDLGGRDHDYSGLGLRSCATEDSGEGGGFGQEKKIFFQLFNINELISSHDENDELVANQSSMHVVNLMLDRN